ncbi:MAG: hypothetical protein AAB225_26620 [Acidobacteriota bacterium]
MPLSVQTIPTEPPHPQAVSPSVVRQRAAQTGNPFAARSLAVTVPILTTDGRQLRFEQRRAADGIEFRFETGPLILTLRHEIYISNELSACARNVWAQHEQLHVQDNNRLLPRMDGEIRNEATLRALLITRQWLPREAFDLIQTTIREATVAIFQRLTGQAAQQRDTRAEYARVQRQILNTCPEPFYHLVESGDTLARLSDFYYGTSSKWRGIYDQNRGVIGANPDVVRVGLRLLIPRRP